MNLELLESFGQNYPEEFDGSLDCISLGLFAKIKITKKPQKTQTKKLISFSSCNLFIQQIWNSPSRWL